MTIATVLPILIALIVVLTIFGMNANSYSKRSRLPNNGPTRLNDPGNPPTIPYAQMLLAESYRALGVMRCTFDRPMRPVQYAQIILANSETIDFTTKTLTWLSNVQCEFEADVPTDAATNAVCAVVPITPGGAHDDEPSLVAIDGGSALGAWSPVICNA